MRARALVVLLGTLLGVVLVAPAAAAAASAAVQVIGPPLPTDQAGLEREEELDDRAPARLFVAQRGRQVCVAIDDATLRVAPDQPDGDSGDIGPSCRTVPHEDPLEPLYGTAYSLLPKNQFGGMVRPEVATVEILGTTSGPTRYATVPAPPALAGTPAGELRYFLGDEGENDGFRLLDAAGQVLFEHLEPTVGDEDAPGPWVTSRVVERGGGAGDPWQVGADLYEQAQPIRGARGRRGGAVCLTLDLDVEGDEGHDGRLCGEAGDPRADLIAVSACAPWSPHVVFGFATAADAPRWVVSGDGRRVPVRVVALPERFGLGAMRVVVAAGRPGTAVRRLEGPRGTQEIGFPPSWMSRCGFGSVDVRAGTVALGGDTELRPAGPAGPRVLVRDDGDRLCVAVERAVTPTDCALPAPWLGSTRTASSADGRTVAGAVDARVRQVRVRLSSGAAFLVPAAPDPAYAGRFAREVSWFAAAAPSGLQVRAVEPLAPSGTPLPAETVTEAPEPATTARPDGLEVSTDCKTRRPVFTATYDRRAATLEVVLVDGRRLRARAKARGDRRVASIAVPSSATVERVTVRTRRGRALRRAIGRFPPGREQCGYAGALQDDVTERTDRPVTVVRG